MDDNFISLDPLPDFTTRRGDNNLETCYQYVVQDNDKMTDKMEEQLTLVVFVIRKIASELWKFNQAQVKDICLNKIDFAVDLKGAFIPKEGLMVDN